MTTMTTKTTTPVMTMMTTKRTAAEDEDDEDDDSEKERSGRHSPVLGLNQIFWARSNIYIYRERGLTATRTHTHTRYCQYRLRQTRGGRFPSRPLHVSALPALSRAAVPSPSNRDFFFSEAHPPPASSSSHAPLVPPPLVPPPLAPPPYTLSKARGAKNSPASCAFCVLSSAIVPSWIRTRVVGFKVQSDDHYTNGT